eukprot:2603456-Pleurochrysis_carterae.AAC.1
MRLPPPASHSPLPLIRGPSSQARNAQGHEQHSARGRGRPSGVFQYSTIRQHPQASTRLA